MASPPAPSVDHAATLQSAHGTPQPPPFRGPVPAPAPAPTSKATPPFVSGSPTARVSFADALEDLRRHAVAVCDARRDLWDASSAVNAIHLKTRLRDTWPSMEQLEQAEKALEDCEQQLMRARQDRRAAVEKVLSREVVKPADWADQLAEAML